MKVSLNYLMMNLMINAKEAKELYEQSSAGAKAYLAKIDPLIREAATYGEQRVALYVEGLWEAEQYQSRMTPIQRRVKEELEYLGFVVTYQKNGGGYVPRGLADDDGNGPIYYDYVLVVGW